jgi:hypothetical protein
MCDAAHRSSSAAASAHASYSLPEHACVTPKLLISPAGAPLGGGWGRCLLLQDIGVTVEAFQYDPRARLAPASQPAAAVTRPLHSINL